MYLIQSSVEVQSFILHVVQNSVQKKARNVEQRSAENMELTDLLSSVVTDPSQVLRSLRISESIQSVFPEQSTLTLHVQNIPSDLIQLLIQLWKQLTRFVPLLMRDAVSSRLWDVVQDILLCGAVLPTVLRTFWFLKNMTMMSRS